MAMIINQLRLAKHRITQPRRDIIGVLTDTPLEVKEISGRLENIHKKIDLATIYRTLDCLVSLNLVNKTRFEDKTSKYELNNQHAHHHHLVCKECGFVEDIILNEKRLMSQISLQSRFKVLNHSLEFFGLCQKCQKIWKH